MNRVFTKKILRKKLLFNKTKLVKPVDWISELDGAAQFWQLSDPVVINDTDDYEIGIILSRKDFDLVYLFSNYLGSENNSDRLAFSNGDPQRPYGMGFEAASVNFLVTGTDKFIAKRKNGVVTLSFLGSDVSRYYSGGFSFDRIGSPWNTADAGYITGYVKDFYVKINEVEVLRIPLTNKAQGATQLPTVGNISAFMPNYTDAVWKNKAELV